VGQCVDLTSDPANCGDCAKPCGAGELCSSGACATRCEAPTTACSGACVDTSTNAKNCGSCGHACGADEECFASMCVPSCKSQLLSAKSDRWGYWWDGNERAPATFDAAQTVCKGIRGRLPTASELYRVSALQSAEIGQSIHTNPLWAITPRGAALGASVKLSDASVGASATTASLFSRCVCPPTLPPTFTGGSCMGTPGQACFSLDAEGKHVNIDSKDRPPLPKGSALWECAFYHGHVADFPHLLEGILSGLPNGTGVNLRVADDALPGSELLLHWTGAATTFAPATLTYGGNADARPFRCAGLGDDVPPHATIPNEFLGVKSRYKSESIDTAATAYGVAHDVCWDRGGHLARSTELGELIQDGLPNGQNAWLRTSDASGFSDTQLTSRVVKWTMSTGFFPYAYPTDTSWSFKTNALPFRCIYYPVDTSYVGPGASACNGGCQAFTLPGGSGAMMWFDSSDRPAAKLDAAVQACLKVGGHLASERDLTEAVRHGLANGSNAFLMTSDLAATTVNVVRWLAVDQAFTDLYPKYASYVAFASANHAFRCVWSNQPGL
jgi:hypothetical protein